MSLLIYCLCAQSPGVWRLPRYAEKIILVTQQTHP